MAISINYFTTDLFKFAKFRKYNFMIIVIILRKVKIKI